MICTSILFGLTQTLLLDPIELWLSASWQTQPASCFSQLICQVFTYSTGSTSNPYNFSFQCIWNMFERMVNNILLTHKQIHVSWPVPNSNKLIFSFNSVPTSYLCLTYFQRFSRNNMSLNFPLLVFICYFTFFKYRKS